MMAPAATNLTNHHPFGIAVRDKGSFFDLFHEPRPIWVEKGDNAHAVGSDSRCADHLVRECKNRSAASGDRSIRQENPQYFNGGLGRRGVSGEDARSPVQGGSAWTPSCAEDVRQDRTTTRLNSSH